jgi:hypothetical protein
VTFSWDSPLTWFEEEEPLLAHARDPHKRVDVVTSSRAVRAEIDVLYPSTVLVSQMLLVRSETAVAGALLINGGLWHRPLRKAMTFLQHRGIPARLG